MSSDTGSSDDKRKVVARALVDPAFRKLLFENPEKVLGTDLSKKDLEGIEQFRKMIPGMGDIVGGLSSNVLCSGGGGCGSSVVV